MNVALPKLLQAAYLREWHPKAIAEYWYGKPKRGEVRVHGMHYPACRGKCLPVLCWMLQGLDVKPPLDTERLAGEAGIPKIIYENQWFCVVEKPSGMLSVPGKGAAVSLQQWLDDKYGAGLSVKMAHRLDQDTSGVIIATFGEEPFRIMQALFATRQIRKTYIADLDGDYQMRGIPSHGRIELPLAPDWLDRPRQVVDIKSGKPALTEYEFTDVSEGRTRVKILPAYRQNPSVKGSCGVGNGVGHADCRRQTLWPSGSWFRRKTASACLQNRIHISFGRTALHIRISSPLLIILYIVIVTTTIAVTSSS